MWPSSAPASSASRRPRALRARGLSVRVIEDKAPGAGASGGTVGVLAPHMPEKWNAKKAFQLKALKSAEAFWRDVERISSRPTGYGPNRARDCRSRRKPPAFLRRNVLSQPTPFGTGLPALPLPIDLRSRAFNGLTTVTSTKRSRPASIPQAAIAALAAAVTASGVRGGAGEGRSAGASPTRRDGCGCRRRICAHAPPDAAARISLGSEGPVRPSRCRPPGRPGLLRAGPLHR